MSLSKELGITTTKTHFKMRGKKYFVIFDPPHLLKSVRNNLLKYNIELGIKEATWDHIKTSYEKEQKTCHRTALKLTENIST